MSLPVLYCRGGCAACRALFAQFARVGMDIEIRDVTAEPAALQAVRSLGYLSLPVLVGPDGTAAAGAQASALAQELTGPAGSAGQDPAHDHSLDSKESR